jgi:hypothetical protein
MSRSQAVLNALRIYGFDKVGLTKKENASLRDSDQPHPCFESWLRGQLKSRKGNKLSETRISELAEHPEPATPSPGYCAQVVSEMRAWIERSKNYNRPQNPPDSPVDNVTFVRPFLSVEGAARDGNSMFNGPRFYSFCSDYGVIWNPKCVLYSWLCSHIFTF